MNASPITIRLHRGSAPPRFGTACTACGAEGSCVEVPFRGFEPRSSLSSAIVNEFVVSVVGIALWQWLGRPVFIAAAVAIAMGALYWYRHGSRSASDGWIQVPLCSRCAAEERANRNGDRGLIAICVAVAVVAFVSVKASVSDEAMRRIAMAALVVVAVAFALRVRLAIRNPCRLEVKPGATRARFVFTDARAARAFEECNREVSRDG